MGYSVPKLHKGDRLTVTGDRKKLVFSYFRRIPNSQNKKGAVPVE
jgi:hypothetical protein